MKAFALTDVGQSRTTNQDYVYLSIDAVGALPNLLIVADGMGGHKAGDVASRSAVLSVVESVKNTKQNDIVSIIEEAVSYSNEELLKLSRSDPEYEGMGTTMVIATIENDSMYVANVGDSRLYLINDNIHQITRDHSYVEAMVSIGELDKESARTHEKKNIITRAIGVAPGTEADFFEVQLNSGDIILMCSDGLTNMVDDEHIKSIVNRNEEEDFKPDKIAQALIDAANENGGKDNIAVLIAKID